MPNAKQIAALLKAEELSPENDGDGLWQERAAEKIVALFDDGGAPVAAAQLEAEVTSALVDMTIATVLATLIEEEGGGRSNIQFSAMAMDHVMKHYRYTSKMEGMIRTVSVELREDSDLRNEDAWRAPSNRHGVMHQDESTSGALPQAEPKDYDRPVWAVRYTDLTGNPAMYGCTDRADAEGHLRLYLDEDPLAHIENRFCLHPECPSTKCTQGGS